MVKMVEDELNIEVREDIRAASITASIIPLQMQCYRGDSITASIIPLQIYSISEELASLLASNVCNKYIIH